MAAPVQHRRLESRGKTAERGARAASNCARILVMSTPRESLGEVLTEIGLLPERWRFMHIRQVQAATG